MLLWYVGPSIVAVHDMFRSRGLDYRLIGLGALLPLLIDLPFGHFAYGHSLVVAVAVLGVVMLATIGRSRLLRRRLICLPIGWMCGLVLSGAFLHDVSFLWPLLGSDFPDDSLFPPVTILVLLDAAGLAITVWAWGRFGLERPRDPRRLPPPRPAVGARRVIAVRPPRRDRGEQAAARARPGRSAADARTAAAQAQRAGAAARGRARRGGAHEPAARARETAAPIAAALGRGGRGRRPPDRARLRRVGQHELHGPAAGRARPVAQRPVVRAARRREPPRGGGARRRLLHRDARRARGWSR